MEQVVNIIVIKGNCLLVTRIREGDWWTLPGGRVEKGESKEMAMKREIKEELPNITILNFTPYKEFLGLTPHSKIEITVTTFFAKIKGSIEPGAELTGSKWADSILLEKLNLTTIAKDIVKSLKNDRYL
jgi:ADP-ribose pyrophosphatase YjhB (NUDIX family)